MLVDYAVIIVKSGDGGDGAVSFRREKYVPQGGPDGGNGGNGGDVIIIADSNVLSLAQYKFKKKYKAENGKNGKKKNQTGAKGKDLILKVPVGTIIKDENNNILCDLDEQGKKYIVCYGGLGGRGNATYKSSIRQAPCFSQKGLKGIEKKIILELKLIADVGIIGLPNAGKSTLLSVLTKAKVKIADYPFTTLSPNLGIWYVSLDRFITLCDIPGIIEDAHKGKGLGIKFLRHIERTKILMHLIDGSVPGLSQRYEQIKKELKMYNLDLLKKIEIIVITKMDIVNDCSEIQRFEKEQKKNNRSVVKISAVIHKGLDELKKIVLEKLKEYEDKKREKEKKEETKQEYKIYKLDSRDKYELVKIDENKYILKNPELERWINRFDLDNPEAVEYILFTLKKRGINKIIRKKKIQEGAVVMIGNFTYRNIKDEK